MRIKKYVSTRFELFEGKKNKRWFCDVFNVFSEKRIAHIQLEVIGETEPFYLDFTMNTRGASTYHFHEIGLFLEDFREKMQMAWKGK